MSEDRLAALAVPDRPTRQIATDRDAQQERAGPFAVRTPANRRRLGLDLLHRRPDVVEELHLRTWPQPAQRLTDAAPDDVPLGQRRVETARDPEGALQPRRRPEDAALA